MNGDSFEAVASDLAALTHSSFTAFKAQALAERLRMLALLPPGPAFGEGIDFSECAVLHTRDVAADEIDEDPDQGWQATPAKKGK